MNELLAKLKDHGQSSLEERRRRLDETNVPNLRHFHYVNTIAHALLDSERHGGWPYRHEYVLDAQSRKALLAELEELEKAAPPEVLRVRMALACAYLCDRKMDRALAEMAEIRKASPYLGWLIAGLWEHALDFHELKALVPPLRKHFRENPFFCTPPFSAFYDRIPPGKFEIRDTWIGEEAKSMQSKSFPYMAILTLVGDGYLIALRQERLDLGLEFNNIC